MGQKTKKSCALLTLNLSDQVREKTGEQVIGALEWAA